LLGIVLTAAGVRGAPTPARRPPWPGRAGQGEAGLNWQSPAKLHRGLRKASGTLIINGAGLEFRPDKGRSIRWDFVDIQTLYVLPRRITVTGYEKRRRILPKKLVSGTVTLPGAQQFRFDLGTNLPPTVAAELAKGVRRPVRNGDPPQGDASIATIPAHHRTGLGGTKSNGILRFRDEGIDYVANSVHDSRSWRWADIQTLSSPDPFHLTVFGYLETYSFDLKQPLQQKIYDRLNDEVYRHHEELGKTTGNPGTTE